MPDRLALTRWNYANTRAREDYYRRTGQAEPLWAPCRVCGIATKAEHRVHRQCEIEERHARR